MAEPSQAANTMNQAFKDLTATSSGLSKEFGIIERMQSKISVGFKSTVAGSMAIYSKAFMTAIRNMGQLHEEDEEVAMSRDKLTKAQKLLYKAVLKFNPVLKLSEIIHRNFASSLDKGKPGRARFFMWVTRLTTYFLFFISGLALVGAAFVIFDIQMSGAQSTVVSSLEDYEALHFILMGLVTLLTGEGGSSGWAMIAASMALAILAGAAVSLTFGGVILVLGLMATAFRVVRDATGEFEFGMMAAIATGTAAVAAFALQFASLGPIFNFLQVNIINGINAISKSWFGASKVIGASKVAFVAGIALVVAGLYGMWQFATGAMSGIQAAILGLVSAVLIGVGLFLLGVAAIPAAIIAGVVLAIATIYRFRQEIWDTLTDLFNWCMDTGGAMLDWFMALPGVISTSVGNAWTAIKNGFFNKLDESMAGASLAFSSIFTIGGALFDDIFNAFAGFVNPAINLYNSIPGVPNLPLIEEREKGGPVTGGKPYLVGEKGPELFTPNTSGNITANDKMGSGQNITLTINVGGVTDRTDKRALAREIGDMLTQELRRTGGAPTRGRF